MAEDEKPQGKEDKKGGRPSLTPEQEQEAAKKKAARAQAKAKGGKAAAAAAAKEVATEKLKRTTQPRLKMLYQAEIRSRLMQELGLKNAMEVPKITKIVVNMGLGEAVSNPKLLDTAVEELGLITGQRPVVTKSKKSIAAFKLRLGQKIGAMVTLRRDMMYEFLDRLVSYALPRVRDFKGVSPKGFDGRGNYTLGVREGIIFPEASFEKVDKPKGMNITITTTARTDEQGRALLRHLGMPFRS
jgi:large subunit ribosomal protein L5